MCLLSACNCRTASDLEEKGLISNIEKGVIKDLIISGDAKFMAAMEKYEKGDRTELSILCRGLMSRKGTVDLLENMDLDFVFEDKANFDGFGFPAGGMSPTSAGNNNSNKNVSAGIAARRPSIDNHVRSNSIFGIAEGEAPLTSFNSSVFDDTQQQIELSAYEAMAKSLSSTKQTGKGTKDRSNGRSTPARPSSRGVVVTEERLKSTYMTTRLVSSPFNSPTQSMTRQQVRNNGASSSSSSSAAADSVTRKMAPGATLPGSADGVRPTLVTSQREGDAGAAVKQQSLMQSTQQAPGSSSSGASTSNGTVNPITATQANPVPKLLAAPASSASASASASTSTYVPAPASAVGVGGSQQQPPVSAAAPKGGEGEITYTESNSKDFVSMTIAGGPLWAKSVDGQRHFIGAYSPEQRRKRIERFIEKRNRRVWTKKVKYDVRKNFADSRLRVKGRFVKKEDEEIMRELMTI